MVVDMFTLPCDVDFERDNSTERPPVNLDEELGVVGSPLDYYVTRSTYSASQTQVRTHAPHTRAAHTRARAHTQEIPRTVRSLASLDEATRKGLRFPRAVHLF